MSTLNEYEALALKKLGQTIQEGKWSNAGLVQLIKLSGEFLNIKTVPDYCKYAGMSYPGAIKPVKGRKVENIFNVKFIIDNE